ncbi:hypothetical protein HS088_TW22G00901 [Tripterygium wilfordii]|uniref:BURP domain-containing protein n=1 Tax=Tripterygium wilfordii TaxID=458696 RepID=A0A7J7BZA4_TRIWF|nr:BURP domain-containing protein BNM2A-like [Tripterygium wilfordii]XP_038692525.1 BURP domain-containing protein BNM2A-like [Tripterygium wilfordii]XP_038692526.1 BURP domain-containing protein BNM2A-like [Tripterygium wilfordii]XP_038692527.1 BURP domain-containing protein BNM2A-like [Tripterygium wilfordii]XP_038692528.1 BURP domain-containing protein BNM2A-like [Tripterygium wilfordii]XP_038692529.1 BURP domain-containing protein BNM2A-like [Tripterygium wilfordii]KAF5727213.1 hypothetic
MGFGVSSWNIFLGVLIVVMIAQGARKITYGEWKIPDHNGVTYDLRQHHDMNEQQRFDPAKQVDGDYHHHQHSHNMPHMDPSVNIFFTIKDLKVGKRMLLHFPNKDPSKSPHLLSQQEASSIPFSSTQLPYLLDLFSFSKDSPQAKAIAYTLRECEFKPIKGETKLCATSLESMLDYARSIFGSDTPFKVVTTNYLSKPTKDLQNYTILERPREVSAPQVIPCHKMPYPYAVFFCHTQKSKNRLFEVLVGAEKGERVQAVAVCHMDTSEWNTDHPSFAVLGIKPGTQPVCHFIPVDNLVWVPSSG